MRSKKRGISELEVITLSVSFVALVMTVESEYLRLQQLWEYKESNENV